MVTQFQDLRDASYIAVETFRKNGVGVKTPVWFTTEGDKHYCWTIITTGKVKRIRNNPEVKLAKCDSRGNLESDWVSALAQILDSPAEIAKQSQRMTKKYGFLFRLFKIAGMIFRSKNVVIEFSPKR